MYNPCTNGSAGKAISRIFLIVTSSIPIATVRLHSFLYWHTLAVFSATYVVSLWRAICHLPSEPRNSLPWLSRQIKVTLCDWNHPRIPTVYYLGSTTGILTLTFSFYIYPHLRGPWASVKWAVWKYEQTQRSINSTRGLSNRSLLFPQPCRPAARLMQGMPKRTNFSSYSRTR